MKKRNLLLAILAASIFLLIYQPALSATIVSAASGNWNAGTTWVGGVPPGATDDAVISSGHTVTVTAAASCNLLTVNAGGTLVCNASLSLPTTTSTVDGTIDITVANGLKKQTSGNEPTLVVSSTGKIMFGTNGSSNIKEWTLNTGSTVEYYGTSQPLSGHIAVYSNLTFSGSGIKTLARATLIAGKLSMQGTATYDAGGFTLTYGAAATIEYKGSANQTIGAEFPSVFNGTGGIIIDNSNGVNLIGMRTISNGLTVTNGPLVISATSWLTVGGPTSLNTPQSMVIQSNASSTGSFIDNGITYTGGAKVNCQRYLSGNQWHYICIPFATMNAWTYLTYYMKYYSEPVHHFKYVIAPGADSILKSNGLGYAMWISGSTVTVNQVNDSLNTGNIGIPVTRTWDNSTSDFDGWNLVGNLYPSSVDLSLLTRTNVEASAWFWDPGAGNYTVWVSGGGGSHSNICPPEQGFFVHCNDPAATQTNPGSGTLGMSNTARVHGTETFLKSEGDPANLLRINAAGSGNNYSDQTAIYFSDIVTPGYDPGFDAEKISGELTAPQIYTSIADYDLSVNALPWSQPDMTVLMGFKDNLAGTYLLSFNGIESFQPDVTIGLEDLKEGAFQDLRSNPFYTFDHAVADDPFRFLLHFGDPNLGNNDLSGVPSNLLTIYSYNDRIYVRYSGTGQLSGNIMVYDIIGREMFTARLADSKLQEFAFPGYSGYYVVKISGNSGNAVAKVFL